MKRVLLAVALALTASTAGTAEASIHTLPATSPSPEISPTTTASPIGPGCASLEERLPAIADQPVGTALSQVPELSMLSEAVTKAGLKEKLDSAKDITVFAPSDEAFEAIPQDARDKVMADKQALTKILTYHVVEGKKMPSDLEGATLKTLQGGELTVKGSGDDLTINNAKLICGDVPTSNATVYIVDKVLMPQ